MVGSGRVCEGTRKCLVMLKMAWIGKQNEEYCLRKGRKEVAKKISEVEERGKN